MSTRDTGGTASAGQASPGFKDHFSTIAGTYAAARPGYPDALFDALAAVVPADARVWEPGCGSGQATRGLAARFAQVHATDPSPQQIAQHWGNAGGQGADGDQAEAATGNLAVAVEPGERASLSDGSVQLIAVAQALHWFDRARFFAECERVLAPGGVLAAWGYPDFLVPDAMDAPIGAFRARIEPYWPPEREQVDARYAGYDWPFPAVDAPQLQLEACWTLPQFLQYLASMSASARCQAATGIDPVAEQADALAAAWGAPASSRVIRWPLFLHLRRKPG
ncbi:class I SAM-dependent methyltransferase [Lysobacter korlensis]|uniref:Class I SAM-dependent methyltransferase n=1 Tax=Lysobacter korlensis TaxID=553636 RepID=A0ABV6RIW7_9GAMM